MAVPSDHDILLALGEALPVGIWVARAPDGALVYANRVFAELVGAHTGEVQVAGFAQRHGLHTRDGAPYPEQRLPFTRALCEGGVVVADDMAIRRDGKTIDLRAVARPVGDPVSHVIMTWFDVSSEVAAQRARADAEYRLSRAQRLETVGTLAAGIAHEFNNLIFSIKLIATEVAARESDPKRRAAMDLIDETVDRSAKLTRSLLGFVRRGKHRAMPVGINDIATSMTELLARTLDGIELTFELDASERGTVIGEHGQLEQLIMNLVLNARDAVQDAGRVVVRTSDRDAAGGDGGRLVVLEVQDDGATPARERSTGQAFAQVFAIVESHGGSIEVDVGLDGRGTTMRILFPAATRSSAIRPRIVPADLPRGTGLILVIDDDPMVRRVVTGSLSALGYTPLEAASGPDAIELYRVRHRDIRAVVLDMIMPGMTGRATYLALRAIDSNVAVLLMSGHTLNDQVQEILDLGVRNFVSKPYSIATLATAMSELTQPAT